MIESLVKIKLLDVVALNVYRETTYTISGR